MQLFLFVCLFICLFLLSQRLSATISLFFARVTRSHTLAIQLLAILFLPGVILHELAHWLLASILFVPTGAIEFFPQVQGDSVKLGSVQIAKTDPLRRFLIGIAPVLFGLATLLGLFFFLTPSIVPVTWKTLIFLYVVFEIGNTMFSSKKDLEGVLGFTILAFLFLTLLFFLKVPIFPAVTRLLGTSLAQTLTQALNGFFLVAIGIDVVVITFLYFLVRLF